ncbi:hypothetical protein P3T18_003116 [Paraburkholderia sp. GAS199]|uniref:hypothetical protein n=1 Tax=Paraburkholderia sp. GAS199 TaxID=3035126 RepID=UPI003D1FEE83
MIHESYYWKQPLLRTANWLERLRVDDNNEERALARLERELFVGFYSIRKLLDTFKVSRATRTKTFALIWSPTVKSVDYMNWHRIDELFNLDTQHIEQRDITFLCNQFVHSYVFIPACDEEGALAGVYVASDKAKRDKVYFVAIDQMLEAFRVVGKDYPTEQHMQRNKDGQWEEIAPPALE